MVTKQIVKAFQAIAVLGIAVGLVGCGPSDGMMDINGTVTMDGEPVQSGSITLTPVNGSSKVGGGTFEDGTFSTRAAAGEMAVQIRGHEIVKLPNPTKEQVERGLDTERHEIVPPAYNSASKLRIKISPENTTFDFALTKDGKVPEGMSAGN